MTRRRRLLIGLAVLALLGVLALPGVHWRLYGWWRGEPFYQGMPASYWRSRVNDAIAFPAVDARTREPAGAMYLYDTGGLPGRLADWAGQRLPGLPRWKDRLKGPMLDPDPDAIPVLASLLHDPEAKVRLFAVQSLGRVGRGAVVVAPEVYDLLNDPTEGVAGRKVGTAACIALRLIDPDALKEADDRP